MSRVRVFTRTKANGRADAGTTGAESGDLSDRIILHALRDQLGRTLRVNDDIVMKAASVEALHAVGRDKIYAELHSKI